MKTVAPQASRHGIQAPTYSWNICAVARRPSSTTTPRLAPTVLAVSGGLQSLTATWEKPAGPVQLYEVQLKEASAPDTNSTDATPATGWDLVATVSKSPFGSCSHLRDHRGRPR